ncbi:MAG: phosphoribosylglycinamide formyltransferase [Planctomycetota bacterium]
MTQTHPIPPPLRRPIRLAVLLSGSGTTLENLYTAIADGRLPAALAVVLASTPAAYGLERARRHGTPAVCVERKAFGSWRDHAAAVWAALEPFAFDAVVLAGYMCRITVPSGLRGKILNVHPALLPAFGGKGMYGHHVHAAVLAAGARETGCTVHVVDEQYDHGPVLAQARVAVEAGDTADTLAARVQAAERALYPQVIGEYLGKELGLEVQ